MIIPKGLEYIRRFAEDIERDIYPEIPNIAFGVIRSLCQQLLTLNARIAEMGKAIAGVAKADGRIKL